MQVTIWYRKNTYRLQKRKKKKKPNPYAYIHANADMALTCLMS